MIDKESHSGNLMKGSESFYAGIKGSGALAGGRARLFDALREQDIHKVEVVYSGGHDEGGTDSIELFATDGTVKQIREHIWPAYKKDTDGEYVMEAYTDWGGVQRLKRKQTPLSNEEQAEMELAQALSTPVYDQWHSFAGEFSVSGTVTWDVEKHTVTDSYDESVEYSEHNEEEV